MRKTILLLSLCMCTLAVMGQDVKQDFSDGEFFLAMEEYEEAYFVFKKVYDAGYQDNANINYRIGICLLQIPGRKTEAIPYLEKAVESVTERYREGSLKETDAPPDAHVYLGNAYRINMEFEKACEQYLLYDEYVGDDSSIQSIYAEQQILSCSNAVVAMNDPVDVTFGNLGQINFTHAETYNMVVSHDMSTLAYMGVNPFFRGIYVARKENGVWSKPQGINPSIMSEGNMDVVGISATGDTLLLAVSDEFASNLYMSVYADGRWNPATSLGKPINSRYYEAHATLSPDGQSIYFTSNRRTDMGTMDIYRSDIQPDGTWGDPVLLGDNINTALNEDTPIMSPDGKRLYFSSQGHNSIGGFDVFYSERQPDGTWGEPVNLGYPLNTTDDDFTMQPTGIQEEGTAFLFASAEATQHPVFRFEIIDADAAPVPVAFEEPEEELAEAVEEPEPAEEPETGEEDEPLVPPAPQRYLVQPVFFAFDRSDLNQEARSGLDQVAELMSRFPSLELTVTGHTDAVGPFDYNQRLSLKRANAVKSYLVDKGISGQRVNVEGKSESEHVARNRTPDNRDAPEGRKLNRRAEFRVSTTDNVIVEMESIEVPEYLRIDE